MYTNHCVPITAEGHFYLKILNFSLPPFLLIFVYCVLFWTKKWKQGPKPNWMMCVHYARVCVWVRMCATRGGLSSRGGIPRLKYYFEKFVCFSDALCYSIFDQRFHSICLIVDSVCVFVQCIFTILDLYFCMHGHGVQFWSTYSNVSRDTWLVWMSSPNYSLNSVCLHVTLRNLKRKWSDRWLFPVSCLDNVTFGQHHYEWITSIQTTHTLRGLMTEISVKFLSFHQSNTMHRGSSEMSVRFHLFRQRNSADVCQVSFRQCSPILER